VLRPAQRGEFLRRIAAAAAHCAHYGSQSDALDPDAPYVVRRDGADVLAGTVAKVVRLTMVDTPSGPRLHGLWTAPELRQPPDDIGVDLGARRVATDDEMLIIHRRGPPAMRG
jgi:hypothetical protein